MSFCCFLRGGFFVHHNVIITDENYSGFNPVQFGYEDCEPSHAFGPAVRTHYLIHFVVSGKGYYKIGNREYKLGKGEMFVIPPYTETYYEADQKDPWHYIWIGFTTDKELPFELNDTIKCPEALYIFNQMKNCSTMEKGKSAYLSARLWDLFSLFLDQEKPETDYVETALVLIHSEYMKEITVSDIAKRLNLDRTYFSTLFKKRVGISPKQYLIDLRLKIAATLMTDMDKSISVAACSVGYTDIFNFSKLFKLHYGVSPATYKSNFKNTRV